jgi:AraC-like DNA-binding protein
LNAGGSPFRTQPIGRSDVLIDASVAQREWLTRSLPGSRVVAIEQIGEALSRAVILITSGWGVGDREQPVRVGAIREAQPGLIILVAAIDPDRLDWMSIARTGVDDVVIVGGETNAWQLGQLVANRRTVPVPEEAVRGFLATKPTGFITTFVSWCLRNAMSPKSVPSMARWFGIPERTLRRRLRNDGLPSPALLWKCARLLTARLLFDSGASVEDVAWRTGYDNSGALRSARSALRRAIASNPAVSRFAIEIKVF